ncbi:hypothetical protein, variant [Fonticula alba]|uniref:Uncharacterized protein n=1 Tax=Fonticula alba TaxID=691883 RepID=A0A058Z284_FONAL|nr:hypothetical protein, variant [Fonticula alba]KCV68018.1 hypothetical protein, variant [Fonticula alba]|eukprot:XP_009497585.1 hypothetical protein, variant [Fonticula alba]
MPPGPDRRRFSRAQVRGYLGHFLSRVLIRPDGVSATLSSILEGLDIDRTSQVDQAVGLVSTPPSFLARQDPAVYAAFVVPQLLELLTVDVADEHVFFALDEAPASGPVSEAPLDTLGVRRIPYVVSQILTRLAGRAAHPAHPAGPCQPEGFALPGPVFQDFVVEPLTGAALRGAASPGGTGRPAPVPAEGIPLVASTPEAMLRGLERLFASLLADRRAGLVPPGLAALCGHFLPAVAALAVVYLVVDVQAAPRGPAVRAVLPPGAGPEATLGRLEGLLRVFGDLLLAAPVAGPGGPEPELSLAGALDWAIRQAGRLLAGCQPEPAGGFVSVPGDSQPPGLSGRRGSFARVPAGHMQLAAAAQEPAFPLLVPGHSRGPGASEDDLLAEPLARLSRLLDRCVPDAVGAHLAERSLRASLLAEAQVPDRLGAPPGDTLWPGALDDGPGREPCLAGPCACQGLPLAASQALLQRHATDLGTLAWARLLVALFPETTLAGGDDVAAGGAMAGQLPRRLAAALPLARVLLDQLRRDILKPEAVAGLFVEPAAGGQALGRGLVLVCQFLEHGACQLLSLAGVPGPGAGRAPSPAPAAGPLAGLLRVVAGDSDDEALPEAGPGPQDPGGGGGGLDADGLRQLLDTIGQLGRLLVDALVLGRGGEAGAAPGAASEPGAAPEEPLPPLSRLLAADADPASQVLGVRQLEARMVDALREAGQAGPVGPRALSSGLAVVGPDVAADQVPAPRLRRYVRSLCASALASDEPFVFGAAIGALRRALGTGPRACLPLVFEIIRDPGVAFATRLRLMEALDGFVVRYRASLEGVFPDVLVAPLLEMLQELCEAGPGTGEAPGSDRALMLASVLSVLAGVTAAVPVAYFPGGTLRDLLAALRHIIRPGDGPDREEGPLLLLPEQSTLDEPELLRVAAIRLVTGLLAGLLGLEDGSAFRRALLEEARAGFRALSLLGDNEPDSLAGAEAQAAVEHLQHFDNHLLLRDIQLADGGVPDILNLRLRAPGAGSPIVQEVRRRME